MVWQIRLDRSVERFLAKLDKPTARRITGKLREISQLDNPRSQGKALTGNLAGLWRYRVGDYHIICDIEDTELVVFVVHAQHRSSVYR